MRDILDRFDSADDEGFQEEWECDKCGDLMPMDEDRCSCHYEDDGQPDEYTEWQDLYGGDDWDHGQYDEY